MGKNIIGEIGIIELVSFFLALCVILFFIAGLENPCFEEALKIGGEDVSVLYLAEYCQNMSNYDIFPRFLLP